MRSDAAMRAEGASIAPALSYRSILGEFINRVEDALKHQSSETVSSRVQSAVLTARAEVEIVEGGIHNRQEISR